MAYISWQLVQVGVLTTKVITTEKVVLMDMNMMNTISSLKELGIFMVRRRCFYFSAVCARARAHEFVQIRCAVILFLNVCGGRGVRVCGFASIHFGCVLLFSGFPINLSNHRPCPP